MGAKGPTFNYSECDPEIIPEWDRAKEYDNIEKHERSFTDAWPLLQEALRRKKGIKPNKDSSDREPRWQLDTKDEWGKSYYIVFTVRERKVRLITVFGRLPNSNLGRR